MKEILNEWKKYLAEQADGTDQREEGPGKTDAEKREDEVPVKTDAEKIFSEFGKQLTPEKYRQALQDFKKYAPKDNEYFFASRKLPKVLRIAIKPEKTNPELLKQIATSLDDNISIFILNLEENEKALERYIDLVKNEEVYGKNRFDSSDVALIVMLDAGYPL